MHWATVLFVVACVRGTLADALGFSTDKENDTHLVLMATADGDPTCLWQTGLSCDLEDAVNNIKLGEVDKCELPVPVPIDNYVQDLRRNKYDDTAEKVASQQPYVQITAARRGGTTVLSTDKAAWYQYVANAASVQKEIVFDTPGVYDMEIIANDYYGEVSCTGCVAILDKFRPRYGTTGGTCPQQITTPQTLTTTSLATFQSYDNAFRTYTADANVVNNPGGVLCVDPDGTSRFYTVKMFAESEKVCATTCFDSSMLATNIGKLKTSPLTTSLQISYGTLELTLNGQCSWCCRKTRTLKEMYTPYMCPNDYDYGYDSPTPSCQGGSRIPNACSINACLQAKGADIVVASVALKSTVQTASTGVLNALPSKPTGADATKHIYYSIPCTTFDKTNTDCRYSVKLSQLLDITTAFKAAFPTPSSELTKVNNYIFWRYNTDGTTFVKWDPTADTVINFTEASTTVVLEAWTACGRAYVTSFRVNLFVHSTMTCSKFDAMWNVIEKPGVQGGEGTYCAYGGSDFAVLKLDMAVADVLQQVDNTVTGTYTGVQCDIMVKPTGGTNTQVVALVNDQSSTKISNYYGIELANNPTTAQKTTGVVHCKFTRTPRSNTLVLASSVTIDTNSIDCSHTFTITDCDAPLLNMGKQEDICADKCAGDSNPGAFEACAGSIVTSSATNTILKPSTPQTCCNKCTQALQCNAVGTTGIKRCEPPTTTPVMLLDGPVDSEHQISTNTTTMILLSVSALVAIVALVVAQRRALRVEAEQEVYYSLLN